MKISLARTMTSNTPYLLIAQTEVSTLFINFEKNIKKFKIFKKILHKRKTGSTSTEFHHGYSFLTNEAAF